MAFYHLDEAVFGMPQYGLSQTPTEPFRKESVGDRGRSTYKSYNPTAPVVVDMEWIWDGSTMRTFREDWEDATKLRYGAPWFTIDLPLGLGVGSPVVQRNTLVPYQFNLVTGTNSAGRYGFAPGYGSLDPTDLEGETITYLRTSSATDVVALGFGGTQPFTQKPPLQLMFPEYSNVPSDMTWHLTNLDYRVADKPMAEWLRDEYNAGRTSKTAVVYSYRQIMRKYVCHFKGTYSAIPLGMEWRVKAAVEVDMSPVPDWLDG